MARWATGSSSRAASRDRPLRRAERGQAAGDRPTASDAGTASLVALAGRVHEAFTVRGVTLASAESCTGGLVGHLLTEIAGSSDYYQGGLISYSDALKEVELGVPRATLERHGAVSAQTCVAMAEGARRRYGADVGVAVTGIAGPGGGSAAKPVGLTYVAIADDRGHDVRRFTWSGDRASNKLASAEACLVLLLERWAERSLGQAPAGESG